MLPLSESTTPGLGPPSLGDQSGLQDSQFPQAPASPANSQPSLGLDASTQGYVKQLGRMTAQARLQRFNRLPKAAKPKVLGKLALPKVAEMLGHDMAHNLNTHMKALKTHKLNPRKLT